MAHCTTDAGPRLTDGQRELVSQNLGLAGAVVRRYPIDGNRRRKLHDVQDLYGEAMLGLCIAGLRFDAGQGVKFSTYGYIGARNFALHEIKRKQSPGQRMLTDAAHYEGHDLAEIAGASPRESAAAEAHEDRLARLDAAIEALPDRLRVVIHGRLAGETLKAIGGRLGVTKERVRQLVRDAHDRIRDAMEGVCRQ